MVERPIEKRVTFTPDMHPRVIDQTSRTAFKAGGIETKQLITTADGKSYIERPFAREYIEAWLRFREQGLPVAPELLVNPTQTAIFTTDFKHDGSELYGKGFKLCLRGSYGNKFERRHPEIDPLFLELTAPERFDRLQHEARDLATVATERRVLLPDDDPMELLIHPDGSHELVILDLVGAVVEPNRIQAMEPELPGYNNQWTQNFLTDLQEIRSRLG